ncbi:MAG: glycosyltransferase family 2 protein [bacterium]|nr:glycosyltransferase family 2 protein [bacterium]
MSGEITVLNKIKYSVVLATYNRAVLLEKCLESLAAQTIDKTAYEVIIVNDGSEDNTEKIIIEFAAKNKDLNFLHLKQLNSGPAKARNAGIQKARGEIVFFTDDDCSVPGDWIEALSKEYQQYPDIAGVGGWYKYDKNEYSSRISKAYIDYMTNLFMIGYGANIFEKKFIENRFLKTPAGNTSNMSYKKSVLDEVGGFDETIKFVGLIDWEMKKRIMDLDHPLLYIPYLVLHSKPLSMSEIARKFFNRGRGYYHLAAKNPELLHAYKPSWRKARRNIISAMSAPGIYLFFIAFFDFIYKSIGWEYQRFIENSNKIRYQK